MKAKISWVLAFCFVLSLLPLTMNAQEPEERYQLYWVLDEVVKPSMQEEYYEAGKKWAALLTKHEFPYPFNAIWTGDNHVMWSVPIESYADIDKIQAAVGKIKEKSPDDYKAMEDAFIGTYESARSCVFSLDYKHSMIAEDAESKSEEENFIFYDIYYFEPGTEVEFNKLFDEMIALARDKGIVQSWYAFWGMMGTDNPVLWTAASAKNAAAFYEENAKMWKVLGEEAGKIYQKMMKYVTKQEQKTAWVQKELSYTPSKKEE
jgi:hypothetical protein